MNIHVVKVKHDKNFIAFIALKDNEAVGWANLTLQLNNKITLQDAYVVEGYRKQGIYSKLWEKRMKYIEKNFKGYEVSAYCNEVSLDKFLRNGFKPTSIVQKVSKVIE